ncbi:MAG TPA: hypothetical protein VFG42_23095 [Baekduia sp.]|uniref:hypothetical protein n=1 Tax=Baekduia sp. TaxID=2600305 RepID=UPI002D765DFE|nr:hypothetical protein [Baekduia sp.]HET6509702.1 hypothetical protein [Baekduia sp.]
MAGDATTPVLVLDAARSPFGARGGGLAGVEAAALVEGVVDPLLSRSGVPREAVAATFAGGMDAVAAATRAVAAGSSPVALAVAVARMSGAPVPDRPGDDGSAQAATALEATQTRWIAAFHRGAFAREVIAVAGVDHDEHPVAGGFADGAAAVLLAAPGTVPAAAPLAEVVAVETLREDALDALVDRLGWGWDGVDLIELHEPSGTEAARWLTRLGAAAGRVNVDGGSLAIGDPEGVSGARLVVSLADLLRRREGARRGLAILPAPDGVIHVAALAAPPR